MRIIYGFSNCSYAKYRELMSGAKVMVLQQAQKYHALMTAGLAANGCEVEAISGLPINRELSKKLYTPGGDDEERGVKYHYFGSLNLPGIRQTTLIIKSCFRVLFARRPEAAICDILNISILIGMLVACRLRRIPLIGIVTDVPGYLASDKVSLANRIDSRLMKMMDGYILLTKQMNTLVNPKGKPYIVIEGQVDSQMDCKPNELSQKASPKVIMYAGSMQRIYGLPMLVDAFRTINPTGWELHVYGDGDYRQELEDIAAQNRSIVYKGIRPNDDIVEAEIKASLLVNPRPTAELFTQYSFPSKNMEYLASGTPTLTTRLPGMPDDFTPYIYLIEDESSTGIARELRSLMSLDPEELHRKGLAAKQYALTRKNETTQAAKVIALIKKVV